MHDRICFTFAANVCHYIYTFIFIKESTWHLFILKVNSRSFATNICVTWVKLLWPNQNWWFPPPLRVASKTHEMHFPYSTINFLLAFCHQIINNRIKCTSKCTRTHNGYTVYIPEIFLLFIKIMACTWGNNKIYRSWK